jgi:hypothetical protein
MKSNIQSMLKALAVDVKRIFLIDCLGALLTAFMLGVILPAFEDYFGMPRTILYGLSAVAFIFAIYSGCCYYFSQYNKALLRIIAFANLFYSCVSLALVIFMRERLTTLGLLYFSLELIIVGILITIELQVARSSDQP